MDKKSEFQVGIDFGTCNIKVASWNNKKKRAKRMHLDSNQDNSDYKIPNAIAYLETDEGNIEKIIGDAAIDSLEPENTVENIKYYLQQKNWSKYIPSMKCDIGVDDVLKDIFLYLKDAIEEQRGDKKIDSVAITTPVCFSEIQKNKIIYAASNVGLPIKEVISEPVAALFSILDELNNEKENIVLVFDFGGATLDLSLISVKKNDETTNISLLSSMGIMYGGLDINQDIYKNIFLKKYQELQKFIVNHEKNEDIQKDLLHTVEIIKRSVSKYDSFEKEWRPYTRENFSIEFKLEKDEFVSALKELGRDKKIISEIDNLLEQASKKSSSVTHLAIIGGSARIPFFKDLVLNYLNNAMLVDIDEEDMYSAVSEGAVKYLHMKEESNLDFINKLPYSIGFEDEDGIFNSVIKRGARFGYHGRRTKASVIDGKINIYQTFSNNNKVKIKEDETIIYMGYFDVKIVISSISKFYVVFNIGKNGDLTIDIWDGNKNVNTLKLEMR